MPIQSINPATGEPIKSFPELTESEIKSKIELAEKSFQSWRLTSFEQRAKVMFKAAEILKTESEHYAKLLTQEMGKPIKSAIAEVEKCAWVCEYYAEEAGNFLQNEIIATDASESYVEFDPLGIILAVMPWNYPFWQVFRFLAPALMAGNVGLLKHASNVPESSNAIEEIMLKAGMPKGVFQNLLIGSSKVEAIIQDPRVKAVTLTGSEYAGSMVASAAAKEIKKAVLELGGSDPFIVLEDADIEFACEVGTTARLQNNGQSCIAAKRFIIHESRLEEFLQKFKTGFESLKIGDPMDKTTDIGPLVSESSLEEIKNQVEKSIELGAKVITGAKRIGDKGYFYAPTILSDLTPEMPVYSEEVFGPVAAVIPFKDEAEAIEIANNSELGLGASIWTKDISKAKEIARRIEAGAVFINSMVKSDPRLPFGGIKKSGFGRELSHYGIKEFVNIKTVWVK